MSNMFNISNMKDDLDNYSDLWQKALDDGIFKDAPKPPTPERDADFFGQYPTIDSDVPLNECDTKYWNLIYKLSKHQGESPDPLASINEGPKPLDNPNPVMPWTKGKDQDMKVTADFNDGKKLTELANLKMELQKLEDKMNADDGMGKTTNKWQKQIESMWDRINKLSDDIQGNDDKDKN